MKVLRKLFERKSISDNKIDKSIVDYMQKI